MTPLFLEPKEIEVLTGIKAKAAPDLQRQCAWLKSNRIPYFVNAAERIVIARAVFDKQQAIPPSMWQPRHDQHAQTLSR